MNIVVVEDVNDLRDEIVCWLRRTGHEVHGVGTGLELDLMLECIKPELVILDIGLPGEDGISICKRLQEVPELHIAMITARASDEDRRRGLVAGADTYLVKPVDYSELEAVIRRLEVRRRHVGDSVLRWRLHTRELQLGTPNGDQIRLTHTETRLLRALVQRSARTATRAEIMMALGVPNLPDDRRIEVNLSRLRAKVKAHCGLELPVKANRSVGYSFLDECRLID